MNETRFYRPSPQPRHKALIVGVCWFCWAASLTHSISELCSDCPDKCPVSQLHNCSICHDPHNAFDEKLKEHHNALKNKVWTQTESLNTGTVSTARVRCNQHSLFFKHISIFVPDTGCKPQSLRVVCSWKALQALRAESQYSMLATLFCLSCGSS